MTLLWVAPLHLASRCKGALASLLSMCDRSTVFPRQGLCVGIATRDFLLMNSFDDFFLMHMLLRSANAVEKPGPA